jgi:hypothetical protein
MRHALLTQLLQGFKGYAGGKYGEKTGEGRGNLLPCHTPCAFNRALVGLQ